MILLMAGLFNKATAETAVATMGGYLMLVLGYTPFKFNLPNVFPDISYGVYLYGWPVQSLILLTGLVRSPIVLFAFSALGAVACGIASWYLVEKPFMKLKSAIPPVARPVSSAIPRNDPKLRQAQ